MKIIIIGTGPAGLMCASKCSENKNNSVYLIDGNEKLGKKLYITGKGRCNVTNNCDKTEFMKNVVHNGKFLYTTLNNFSPKECIEFFENNNLELKTERGNRVFPVSDKASDVTKVFENILVNNNVKTILNTHINSIKYDGKEFTLATTHGRYYADAVVVATGGKSYSSTGSTGSGYIFAKQLGHTVIEPSPALVPIRLKDYSGDISGLSLKNVSVTIRTKEKDYKNFGEMLFTLTGVSGPIILTLSSLITKCDLTDSKLIIDLKPKLSKEQLDNRLIKDFEQFKTKILKNYLKELLPSSLIAEFITKGSLNGETPVCNITREVRTTIVNLLKSFEYDIECLDSFDYAVVTSGGVNVKEINPKNMESKIIKNLFFVGEVLDIDALTGGFNIQIALSTGFMAGEYLKNYSNK